MADKTQVQVMTAVRKQSAASFERDTLQRMHDGVESVQKYMAERRFFIDTVEESMVKHANKECIVFGDTVYTYADVDRRSNQFANFVINRGLKFGDTVAVLMYNEPAFFWTVFGLAKVGIKSALLNFNLRHDSLVHCTELCQAKYIVVGQVFRDRILRALHQISGALVDKGVVVWCVGDVTDLNLSSSSLSVENIENDVRDCDSSAISREYRRQLRGDDALVYMFTSGTTGLPKAARVIQSRMLLHMLRQRSDDTYLTTDRVYLSLPVFHGTGFIIGASSVVSVGATMILAPTFSVTKFWDDVIRHQATAIVHIGEICRYLLSRPPSPQDVAHKVRMIIGNGLTKDIWTEFQTRFGIPYIYEFYGATDGTFSCINKDNTPGAVGRFTPNLKEHIGFELVKCDIETAKPLRNSHGRCIPVQLGDAGLLIQRMSTVIPFGGYKDQPAMTERKIIRDAFADRDEYFNSGDLLRLDHNYYLYFVDRIGDTFRWKGENVSTTEVAQMISTFPDVTDSRVYGVKVPGHEGRGGMAAIVIKCPIQSFDFSKFYQHLTSRLPRYACPLFVRVGKSFDVTGTHKVTNERLKKEGFDPNVVDDVIYYMDTKKETYIPLNRDVFKTIILGKSRL